MTGDAQEWSSYLPDGRAIRVRRADGGWHVTCGEATASGDDLIAAMETATGARDARFAIDGSDHSALRQWIVRHTRLIADEIA